MYNSSSPTGVDSLRRRVPACPEKGESLRASIAPAKCRVMAQEAARAKARALRSGPSAAFPRFPAVASGVDGGMKEKEAESRLPSDL